MGTYQKQKKYTPIFIIKISRGDSLAKSLALNNKKKREREELEDFVVEEEVRRSLGWQEPD